MTRPLPDPDTLTAPYWRHAREGRLALPRCNDCGRHHFYPRPACPHCGGRQLEWVPVSGRGSIYSFSVVHRAPGPTFADDVPYVVAIVRIEEGPHLFSRIDADPRTVAIGQPVRVGFDPVCDEISLPVFVPDTEAA